LPADAAVDAAGNLLIADNGNSRVRVVAASTGTGDDLWDIYTVAGNGADRFSGDGGSATKAGLEWPSSVTVHATGNLVIADSCSTGYEQWRAEPEWISGATLKSSACHTESSQRAGTRHDLDRSTVTRGITALLLCRPE
jgi:hypothetical protein